MLTADDKDLNRVIDTSAKPWDDKTKQEQKIKTASWREEGPWLLLLVLPLAALAFRRGALVCIVAILLMSAQPEPAMAWEWNDLWQRPDQQGAQLLEQNKAAEAAQHFQDPAWRGQAYYQAGDFAKAAEAFAQVKGADGQYNLGNALARQGKLDEAIKAYDEALKLDPDHADAKFNRDLVKSLQQKQQQQSQQNKGDRSQQQNKDQQKQNQQSGQNGQQNQQQDQSQNARQQQGQNQKEQNQQGASQQEDQNKQAQSAQQKDGQSQKDQTQSQQPMAKPKEEGKEDQSKEAQQQALQKQEQEQSDKDKGDQQGIRMEPTDEKQATENQQAVEQWLRRIPDDPGGLLRRKFQYQYEQEKQQGNSRPQEDQAW